MERGTGDRGVSEVMGFILVFGMLVLSFTVYQGIVVPEQNRQVEFQHNQDVQGQLQDLRNAILSTAATGSGQAVSVTLGASYPTRAIAQNLGVSGGSLQTTDAGRIRIDNARALDAETNDYLDGNERTFDTKSIRYTPVYSFYSGAPDTRYEHSLLYNQFGSANLTFTDQVLVDGRRITLIAINGSLSASQRDTVSISTEAISASSNRVAVRNASGGPINVTIPTRLSASEWTEILVEENVSQGGHVENIQNVPGENAVNVSLEAGVTYELRMAKIGVGDVTSDERPKYITAVGGGEVSVSENGTQKMIVEVRDRFNNPVSNVTVSNLSGTPTLGSLTPTSETTDSDGRATFTYTAPDNTDGTEDVDVEFSFEGDGTANETVTFELDVLDSDGSGGDDGDGGGEDGVNEVNPGDPSGDVIWVTATRGGSNNVADVVFNNTGSERRIEAVRIPFYYEDNDPENAPDSAEFFNSAGTSVGSIELSSPIAPLDIPLTLAGGGTETTFTIEFTSEDGNDPQTRRDFFILVLELDGGARNSYFISVSQ